jgi:hypothetical protein
MASSSACKKPITPMKSTKPAPRKKAAGVSDRAKKTPATEGAAPKTSQSDQSVALEPRQQRFVDEYLIDFNATQAAIRAGYSPFMFDELVECWVIRESDLFPYDRRPPEGPAGRPRGCNSHWHVQRAGERNGDPLTAKEKKIHTQGLIGVLRTLHDELVFRKIMGRRSAPRR